MKNCNLAILILITLVSFSCVSIKKISRHDFDSGYFKLKSQEGKPEKIYAELTGDSLTIFGVNGEGKSKAPDASSSNGIKITNIRQGDFLCNSVFIKNSLDFDLSTILIKYRSSLSGVPNQLNANLNGAFYLGYRRDFFSMRSKMSPLHVINTQIRHIGFDAGVFAGIGITPVNPTVTNDHILLEYDGIVFQKGIAGFITIEFMSVGIALGFDNLMDNNSKYWVYNQKPWIGVVIGIANF